MYKREYYHTKEDAYNAAFEAVGEKGIIDDNSCNASDFDYIARDAINDERDGDCNAFWAFNETGLLIGVYAYTN